jgi:hypothetical protein
MLTVERTITGTEPITLTEAKQYLRVLYDNDDDVITQLITQARQILEQATAQSLIEQSISVTNDDYKDRFRLPYGPVTGVTTLKLTTSIWTTDILSTALISNSLIVYEGTGILTAEYTAGGIEQEGMKLAILELIAHFFVNRGTDNNYPNSVRRWIMNHSLNTFA